MKQFWRRMTSFMTAAVMCVCLVCSPVWAAGAEVEDILSVNDAEVVETAEQAETAEIGEEDAVVEAEPETAEAEDQENFRAEAKTPNEEMGQEDDMGVFEVYTAQTSMDYYTAVSELVKDQEDMGVFSGGEYESARLLIKGAGNLDFSQYEGVQKVVSDMEGRYTVQFSDSQLAEEAAAALNGMDGVEYAEPDRKMTIYSSESDTEETGREALDGEMGARRASQHKSWGIGHIGADEYAAYASSISSRTVKVAVIDTGVDASHTYLEGRVLAGRDFVDNDSDADDGHYHGTHVAGTVVDGTMELTNIKIIPVRVLNSQGKGSSSNVANGIRYAADQGADVINMSLGGGHSSEIDSAVRYAASKNALCVVAAGNDNIDTSYECPAHIEDAVTVAAIDSDERKAYFSNYGDEVDLCAPGVDIVSCVPGGNYRSLNGTSMATPHAAACAALLKLANAAYTPAQLQEAMKASCRDLGDSGWDRYYGNGIIDLRKSLSDENPDQEPASVTTPDQDVVLNQGESKTITLTAGGNLPDRFYLNYAESGSGFTCSWKGGWYDNHKHDLEITATETAGRGTITVSLKDSYADTAVATAQINVRVGDTRYPVGGTVTDWNYLESAHNYTSGSDYTWTYTSPESSRGMALTFDRNTEVESGYDYIYIYSGSATDGDDVLTGTYTGTELAGQTVNVSGQTVKIRLTSDSSVEKWGFKVTNLVPADVKYPHGSERVEDWHDLESQHNYEGNSDYTWVYTHPGNADSLDVTFSEETKIEGYPYDHIHVMDGSGNEVGVYYGTDLAGQTISVPGKTVKIRLVSDGTVNYYGFRVSDLKAVSAGDGGDTVVDDWRELESKHNYDNNYDHTWVYTHPGNASSLDVTFDEQTKVENSYDHIYIYTGDGTQVGDYTGDELAGKTINVSGSVVKIRLTSDSSVGYYGFKVTDVKAGKSSDFPESEHDYKNNFDYTWTWTGPEDALNLDVTFDDQTKVENRYDHIYIYDGSDVQLGDYTGTELAGKTIRVPKNVVKIRLVSDSSRTYYGFKVTDITPLYSNTNVEVKAQDISAPSGALAEVPVTISKNPGIAGLSFDISYDETLMTLDSAQAGSVLSKGTLSVNRNIVNWYNNDNVAEDGTILILKFRINTNAEPGNTTVNVGLHGGKKNLRDKDSNYIEAVYQSGTINITGGLLGDLNGDGDLTIGDVVCLSRALDELVQLDERQKRLADVDGDGDMTIGDLIRLHRIVLGEISPSVDLAAVGVQEETPERTVNISVGNGTVSRGEKLSLPVEISNNYGIAGLAFSVSIPEGCTLDSISEGSLLKGVGTFKTDGSKVIWYSSQNVTDNGVLFYVNLTAGEEAQSGAVSVSLADGKINNLANQNSNSIGADFTDGKVTLKEEDTPKDPVSISSTSIERIPNQDYTGQAIRPELTIRDGNKTLEEGEDYTVSYYNNVKPGTALVTITGKGSYTGFAFTSFIIEGDEPDEPAVEKGRTYTVGNLKYKVTSVKTNGSGTVTVAGVKTKGITSATIGKTVKINGSSLKTTAIASQAFKGCTKLKTVKINANVTQIGKDAFKGDKKLQKVTISSTALKSIGSQAFYGCSKLTSITLKTSRLNSVGKNAVKGIGKKAVIKVPSKKVKAYKKLFSKKTGFRSPMKVKK